MLLTAYLKKTIKKVETHWKILSTKIKMESLNRHFYSGDYLFYSYIQPSLPSYIIMERNEEIKSLKHMKQRKE